jgi:GNAT superfamily N-acetyltransferase
VTSLESEAGVRSTATELQSNEIESLAKLLASVFGGELVTWQEWFAQWWTSNPACDASMPRGWTARSAAGNLVAFTANIPFRYVIDGKPALCFATGCMAVDPRFRGRGLAKEVGRKFLDQAQGDLLVGTDSTPVAYGLWRSLGMETLDSRWLKTHFRILADGPALATAFVKKAGLPSVMGRAAGSCIGAWLEARAEAARPSKSLSVVRAERFVEADADDIENFRASRASTYSWRDVRTLNWLYFGTRYLERTRTVLVARSGSRLVGYLAMRQWHGDTYFLLECRCRDADPDIARELFWHAREFARRDRARSIFVRPYTAMIEAALPRSARVQLARPSTTYCYRFRAGDVNVADWEATPGDGDVSLN